MRSAFVGRDRELAALADYLEDAQQSRPSIVLCRGEPGIGKTRLAEELAVLASDRDVPVLWGVAVESEDRRRTCRGASSSAEHSSSST